MKIPDRQSWKELQGYLVWRGISWKEAAIVVLSAGFLFAITGAMLVAAFQTSSCGGGL
jgi:hypothetical protein